MIKTALVPLIGYNSFAFESLRLIFSVIASQHLYKYYSGNHRLISAFDQLITFLHSSTLNYFVKKIIKHITPNFKLKQDDLEGKTGFLRDTT